MTTAVTSLTVEWSVPSEASKTLEADEDGERLQRANNQGNNSLMVEVEGEMSDIEKEILKALDHLGPATVFNEDLQQNDVKDSLRCQTELIKKIETRRIYLSKQAQQYNQMEDEEMLDESCTIDCKCPEVTCFHTCLSQQTSVDSPLYQHGAHHYPSPFIASGFGDLNSKIPAKTDHSTSLSRHVCHCPSSKDATGARHTNCQCKPTAPTKPLVNGHHRVPLDVVDAQADNRQAKEGQVRQPPVRREVKNSLYPQLDSYGAMYLQSGCLYHTDSTRVHFPTTLAHSSEDYRSQIPPHHHAYVPQVGYYYHRQHHHQLSQLHQGHQGYSSQPQQQQHGRPQATAAGSSGTASAAAAKQQQGKPPAPAPVEAVPQPCSSRKSGTDRGSLPASSKRSSRSHQYQEQWPKDTPREKKHQGKRDTEAKQQKPPRETELRQQKTEADSGEAHKSVGDSSKQEAGGAKSEDIAASGGPASEDKSKMKRPKQKPANADGEPVGVSATSQAAASSASDRGTSKPGRARESGLMKLHRQPIESE